MASPNETAECCNRMVRCCRIFALLVSVGLAGAQTVVTVAGVGQSHRADVDGKPALDAPLSFVYGLLLGRATGRLILHDVGMIEQLEPDGSLLVLAGGVNLSDSSVSDGTPASVFRFLGLRGMAEDAAGSLYVSDAATGRVYRIGRDGRVTIFAGGRSGLPPSSFGDGGPASRAMLLSPRGLVFDSKGNLYIADAITRSIRRVSPDGIISTVYTLPSSPVIADRLRPFPYFEGLAIDADDNLYAAVYSGDQVLRISPEGAVTVVAGTGEFGFSGDGGPAVEARLNLPSGIAVDASGTLYIADTGNHRVRKVTRDGTITTIAGTRTGGFSGDGGPAVAAELNAPAQVLPAPDGSLYIADYNNQRVRLVSSSGIITTVAGSGRLRPPSAKGPGDGGPAIAATLATTSAVAFDSAGNLLVAELAGARIRRVTPNGIISTIAGDGTAGFAGDQGPAVDAKIAGPVALTIDPHDNIYMAGADSRVRRIDPGGTIVTVAGIGPGTGPIRSQGDGGPAVAATLNEPKGLAVDAAGNLYIADTSNARLRMVDRNGIIRTISGPGQLGVDYWNGVAIDPSGNVYVAITHADPASFWSVIDRVNPDGSRSRIAGNGQPCGARPTTEFPYDHQPATSVPLCTILSMTFDAGGLLYIPESFYGIILRVDAAGTIGRIAGSSQAAEFTDGGPALAASLGSSGYFPPPNVALDRNGNLFVPSENRVREVTAAPLVLRSSPDRLQLRPGGSERVTITTNFAQPFAYLAQAETTDGAGWLAVNRSSGLTGETIVVSAQAGGLAPGVYRGTVTIRLIAGTPATAELPVSLTVP